MRRNAAIDFRRRESEVSIASQHTLCLSIEDGRKSPHRDLKLRSALMRSTMSVTSVTQLVRLRDGSPDAWTEFLAMYESFLRGQLERMLKNAADVEEVQQDVLAVLVTQIKMFERQRDGSFRKYLRLLCRNKALELLGKLAAGRLPQGTGDTATAGFVEQWSDPSSELSLLWDEEHRQFALKAVLAEARKRCGEKKIAIFLELKQGRPREEVAQQFEISLATVFRIQAEVAGAIEKIRAEWGDLLDLDELVT